MLALLLVARGTELVNAAEPTTDTTQTYTVAGLTRAELLDGTFEVQVRASRGNSNTALTASLDAVSVTVDHTIPGAAAAPTYDANGNMLTDGSYGNRTYTYDALGRLTGVNGNGVAATYTLDGDANRWAETLNAVMTSFDLDLSVANPTVLFDGSRRYLPGAPAMGYEEAGVWWSGLADQNGSPLLHVSQAGATTTPVHYDPYGGPLPGSTDPTGIGYAAEWKNATGLINLRARSYDPVSGRFVGRDSFGGAQLLPQTANRYAYANLNPLRYGDPSG
ncbi:MAG: RHS repeat-associated core domain-containing protein, partial [Chloroflexi bacterium]|nr:RHS repeat-associated core domain-containing protein [Chloroflexota bacterium]